MNVLPNLFNVLFNLIQGTKKDYFLAYKYDNLKRFYGNKVLDVGAGRGRFSRYLAEKGHEVSSIDVVDLSDNAH